MKKYQCRENKDQCEEDLYTNVKNDIELYLQLKDRVAKTCKDFNVELLELYGVIFNGKI